MNCTLQVLSSVRIRRANWPLVQDLLLHAILFEPGSIRRVLYQLLVHKARGYNVDLTGIGDALNKSISQHAPVGHGSEVAWRLWALKEFGLPVDSEAAQKASGMDDDFVALVALDCNNSGLIPGGGLDTARWQTHMTREGLYSEHWLLSYEANIRGWLASASLPDHAQRDPNFRLLKSSGVSFYDSSRPLVAPPPSPATMS